MTKEIKTEKGHLGSGIMPLDLPSLANADLAKYVTMPVTKISFVGELSRVTYKNGTAIIEVSKCVHRMSATVQVRDKDGWQTVGGGPSVEATVYGIDFEGEATYIVEDRTPSQLDTSVIPATQEQLEATGVGSDWKAFTPVEVPAALWHKLNS